jgi:hypothetical protein
MYPFEVYSKSALCQTSPSRGAKQNNMMPPSARKPTIQIMNQMAYTYTSLSRAGREEEKKKGKRQKK